MIDDLLTHLDYLAIAMEDAGADMLVAAVVSVAGEMLGSSTQAMLLHTPNKLRG